MLEAAIKVLQGPVAPSASGGLRRARQKTMRDPGEHGTAVRSAPGKGVA
jgi:hypothetical protein